MTDDIFTIGDWSFDPREPVLRRGAEDRRLEDRVARSLTVLCRNRGKVVSKGELLEIVWDGRQVSPNSVAIVISSLRRALDDDPQNPSLLFTIARRGYRLVCEPQAVVEDAVASPPAAGSSLTTKVGRLALPACLVVIFLAACLCLARVVPHAVDMQIEGPANETGRSEFDSLARALGPVVVDAAVRLHGVHVMAVDPRSAPLPARLVLRSRLILWDGAPELALTMADRRKGEVLWTAFAGGPPSVIAAHVAFKIKALQPSIPR